MRLSTLDPERRVVRGPGPHYPIPGYPPGPPPAHRVEIWVGAMSPGALRLIGTLADGWVPGAGYSRIAEFPTLTALIDEAALATDRDPNAIRRIVNISGSITDGARGKTVLTVRPGSGSTRLSGWATDLGIDGFIFWPPDDGVEQVERFAAEVAPAVRVAIAAGD